jgi:DNA-binding MarR family transcriptional regulator
MEGVGMRVRKSLFTTTDYEVMNKVKLTYLSTRQIAAELKMSNGEVMRVCRRLNFMGLITRKQGYKVCHGLSYSIMITEEGKMFLSCINKGIESGIFDKVAYPTKK